MQKLSPTNWPRPRNWVEKRSGALANSEHAVGDWSREGGNTEDNDERADAVRHTHVDAGVGVGTRNVGCTLQERATGFGKRLAMTNYVCTGDVINCISIITE